MQLDLPTYLKIWRHIWMLPQQKRPVPDWVILLKLLILKALSTEIRTWTWTVSIFSYSRVRNKRTHTFINFWNFFQGLLSYYGLKRLTFYYISFYILRGYVYYFCQIFQRLRLFKGLRLFQSMKLNTLPRNDLLCQIFWGLI